MIKQPAVYLLASAINGTLYIGVTSDLVQRVWQHREGLVDGFTKRHDVKRLVWFELHGSMEAAIVREKQLKAWKRAWKMDLIEASNPSWNDLWPRLPGQPGSLDGSLRSPLRGRPPAVLRASRLSSGRWNDEQGPSP